MDDLDLSLNMNQHNPKPNVNVKQNLSNVIIHKCKIPILVRSKDSNSKAKAIRAIYVECKKVKQINRSTKSAVAKQT